MISRSWCKNEARCGSADFVMDQSIVFLTSSLIWMLCLTRGSANLLLKYCLFPSWCRPTLFKVRKTSPDMYGTIELDECNDFTLGPQFAFNHNDQRMEELSKEILDGLWEDIIFTNDTTECYSNDTANLWNTNNFLPLTPDIDNSCDNVEAGALYRVGASRIEPQSPMTESEHAISDLESAEFPSSAPELTQTLAQPKIPAISTESQPRESFPVLQKRLPNDGTIDVDGDGACKRRRPTAWIEDEEDGERQFTIRPYQNGGPQKRRLACPYRKLDPYRHRDCARYTLHRIKDVKQHIDRRHRTLDVYCARCYASFPSQTERDEHTRVSQCEILPRPRWVAVTDEQREELNRTSVRKASPEQQWFKMWDILFPGETRPRSAFSGNYIEEVIPVIRHCWVEKSSSIIDNTIKDHGGAEINTCLLQKLMDTMFDRLEEEVRGTTLSDDSRMKRNDISQSSRRHPAKRSRIE